MAIVPASTWPNPNNTCPGIKEGTYDAVYSKKGHKRKTNGIRLRNGGIIPTLGPNPKQNGKAVADGVNMHKGDKPTNRGSRNCLTIQPSECNKVWNILKEGEKGTVTVIR
jgi:hypothetical protein